MVDAGWTGRVVVVVGGSGGSGCTGGDGGSSEGGDEGGSVDTCWAGVSGGGDPSSDGSVKATLLLPSRADALLSNSCWERGAVGGTWRGVGSGRGLIDADS